MFCTRTCGSGRERAVRDRCEFSGSDSECDSRCVTTGEDADRSGRRSLEERAERETGERDRFHFDHSGRELAERERRRSRRDRRDRRSDFGSGSSGFSGCSDRDFRPWRLIPIGEVIVDCTPLTFRTPRQARTILSCPVATTAIQEVVTCINGVPVVQSVQVPATIGVPPTLVPIATCCPQVITTTCGC